MGIGMAILLGLVLAAVVALMRGFGGRSGDAGSDAPKRTPLDTLAERYARGEIDRDEFERKRRDLGGR